MTNIGAQILAFNQCGKPKVTIRRSVHLSEDTGANEIIGGRFEKQIMASITHLGLVETNTIQGKETRDTIRVRSNEPLHAAVPSENAEEDILEYDGALWRITSVRRLKSTWRANAVRMSGKKEFCKDDTNGSSEPSRIRIV